MRLLVVLTVPIAAFLACSPTGLVAETDAGTDACSSATLKFQFEVATTAPFCAGAPNSCSSEWLMIRRRSGEDVVIDRPCVPACNSCEPVGCIALCAVPTRIPAEGMARMWDGRYFAVSACAGGGSCFDRNCAEPGRYVATMCAYPDLGNATMCVPDETPRCTDVPFDWPPPQGYGVVFGRVAEAQ